MTHDPTDPPDWKISTDAEFDSALQELLLSALEKGLALEGAWDYRNGQPYPDLEVLITELSKQS